MPISNYIAQMGRDAGAGFTQGFDRGVRNAMAERELELRDKQQQNLMAKYGKEQDRLDEEAERQYFGEGIVQVYNAPRQHQQAAYESLLKGAYDQGFDVNDAPPLYSEKVAHTLAAETGADLSGINDKLPSDVQSFRYYETLTPEQKKEFLNTKRAGKTLNLGGRQVLLNPTGGVGESYDVTPKPSETPEFQAQVTTEKERAKAGVEMEVNAPKLAEKARLTIGTIDNTVATIDEALDKVSWRTTGAIGKTMSSIPGTEAYNLKTTVLTVKANIGFDRLQAMRDASPTGGALGNVANQELDALQATISSLDLGQSPSQMAANLNKVKQHYENWRSAVTLANEQGGAGQQQYANPAQAGGVVNWSDM